MNWWSRSFHQQALVSGYDIHAELRRNPSFHHHWRSGGGTSPAIIALSSLYIGTRQ